MYEEILVRTLKKPGRRKHVYEDNRPC